MKIIHVISYKNKIVQNSKDHSKNLQTILLAILSYFSRMVAFCHTI